MHIVLLNDDLLPQGRGGAATVVDRLEKAYKRQGHAVTLLTTHRDAAVGPVVRSGGVVSIFSDYLPSRRHRMCLGHPAMRTALSEIFATLKPDAVHAHNVHAHLTYESLLIAKKFTEKVVLTAHDVFLVAFRRVAGERFERLALQGKPIRMHWWEHAASVGRKYWPLRNVTIRNILRESQAHVVAISEAHRAFLQANGIIVGSVIPNGTEVLPPVSDERIAAFRSRLKLTGPTVLFGGRLSEDKGIGVLLKAFERVRGACPDAQLLIVGDADRVAQSLKSVESLLGTSIILAGWLTAEDMRVAYGASHAVTTPSLCFDPFNLMNIEAMAEGKPVVATCFGGAPEIIVDGETGFIVNPRDVDAFAAALLTLLNDPEQAEHMGNRARERARRHFSIEKQCGEYLSLLS